MNKPLPLRLVSLAVMAAALVCGDLAIAQHDLASAWSSGGQLLTNPFRQTVFQQQEEAPPSPSDTAAPQLDSAFKPIGNLGVEISPLPSEKLPEGTSLASAPKTSDSMVLVRPWPTLAYHWVAPATRHNPLYFEEVNAERYGYTCSPCLQPAISTAHFFGTLPALPYLIGADCCRECQYTLGHYRPGSCNPWRPHYWPLSARGALCQAGVVTGVAFLP